MSVDGGYNRQMEKCQFGSVELPERDKTMDELQLGFYLVSDKQMKGCNINIHPLTWIFSVQLTMDIVARQFHRDIKNQNKNYNILD